MSGGSYEYAYYHVDAFADSLKLTTPLRQAFQKHLRKVAQAMHDIEWVDSGDYLSGEEAAAIEAVLGNVDANAVILGVLESTNDILHAVLDSIPKENCATVAQKNCHDQC